MTEHTRHLQSIDRKLDTAIAVLQIISGRDRQKCDHCDRQKKLLADIGNLLRLQIRVSGGEYKKGV